MKRKIYLHGALGERYGEVIELNVATAAEAVRALAITREGFGEEIRSGAWHVVRTKPDGDVDSGLDFDESMLRGYRLGKGELHILPVVAGSKRSGLLKIILGVALVGAAFFMSGGMLSAPLAASGALSGLTYGNVAMIGLAVAASGVSELLAPEEKTEKKDESYLFSGPQTTYREGSAIPLVYGEVITGGVLISVGMDAEDLAKDTDNSGKDDNEEKPETDPDYRDPWGGYGHR